MNLTNNTILITGGTNGIGFELAKQLLQLGNTVIVTGRDTAKLQKTKKELPKIHTIQSDVSKIADIDSLFAQVIKDFPQTNILINNAGIMREINLHDHQSNLLDLTREIETNLCGPIRLTSKFLNHLKAKPTAAIVNVSSGVAFVPLPTSPIYCATKAALHSFTQSLRVQLKNTKINVFELAPPATQTELLASANPEDMKGVSIMKVEDMVAVAIKGFQSGQLEIRPGQANQLKFMSRLAPEFILKQLSRPVERMLASAKH
jgi:uncharacterized oxidoreductase